MMVNKFLTDEFMLNSSFSAITGLPLSEINLLEREFLDIIDYNLVVDATEYQEYLSGLTAFFKDGNRDEIAAVSSTISTAVEE